MNFIKEENLLLEKEVFARESIEKRMKEGGFNSFSKFELFVWDLEMFLQLQKKLGDKIILKGGAATQFYLPVPAQRTSIDIDMICLATKEEVRTAIEGIEENLGGESKYCKFIRYQPENPKVKLDELETYYVMVPSVCDSHELYSTNGKQQVKIEFLYSTGEYKINRIIKPELFALETEQEFNILALEDLFADKLTTLGPNTIGISDHRKDEQFKQLYDVVTLFTSNVVFILNNKESIKENYIKVAKKECKMHCIEYDAALLYEDMQLLLKRIENIETNEELMARAYDFQGFYLRNTVNRDKSGWVIAAYQIELLIRYLFEYDNKILEYYKVEQLIERLQFNKIHGPEKGKKYQLIRDILKKAFLPNQHISEELFKKKFDRIIWELMREYTYMEIYNVIKAEL